MSLISDSDAVLEQNRIFPQHQSALTLLNVRLQDPDVDNLKWLDLACGQGQIISQLLENLSPESRGKLFYVGFDIQVEHTKSAEKIATRLGLKGFKFDQGDLRKFTEIISAPQEFDFITCTNTAHEVDPKEFSKIIFESILRLSQSGELFLYDMESLTEPELGALPWTAAEISILFKTIFDILSPKFIVQTSTWNHKSCKGWTATIQRKHVKRTNEELIGMRETVIKALGEVIDKILLKRFSECNAALESYCKFGADTPNDEQDKIASLYKFWALHRAMGAKK